MVRIYQRPFGYLVACALLALTFLLSLPSRCLAQSGSGMYDAIPIPLNCGGGYYWDYRNTAQGFYDSYWVGSGGPWYTFTLASTAQVDVSLCGSDFDTQVLILDQFGSIIAWNNDNGPMCWGTNGSVSEILPAGTYYIVAQGADWMTGNISVDVGIYSSGGSAGSSLSAAIDAGTLYGGGSFSDTRNNGDPCFYNSIGQVSSEIYYRFSLATAATVTLSHCGSGIGDSFMHLLNSAGQLISSNDDNYNNGCPNGRHSYITTLLPAGTYYVVSEGYGSSVGLITTNISVSTVQAPSISYSISSPIQPGSPFTTSPTNTGGAVSGDVVANTIISNGGVNNPLNTATDSQGNVYVADAGNHRILKMTPGGTVVVLAGTGYPGYEDGTGTSAVFRHPSALVVDGLGNVYVSDQQNHRIRRITAGGVVTTLAGSGSAGSSNGTGTGASFSSPIGLALDGQGNLYVADYSNHRIRKIVLSSGAVSTYAGNGGAGMANGPALSASFRNPMGLGFDQSGNLYVADRLNHAVRKIASDGTVSTLAGNGSSGSSDGTGASATFNYTNSLTVGTDGNVYVADYGNNMIRKISSSGVVTTLAGTTSSGTVDGMGNVIRFSSPYGLSIHGNSLYIAQNGTYAVRKLSWGGYSISPELPPGLSFDSMTGVISGIPTGSFPTTLYTVTAGNAGGTSAATFTLGVSQGGIMASSDQNYIMIYTNRDKDHTTVQQVVSASSDLHKVHTSIRYFDGLGRPMQDVMVMGSPTMKDIVTPITYDALGREDSNYLAYAAKSGASGSYRSTALADQLAFYHPPVNIGETGLSGEQLNAGHARIPTPFSKTVFEASPLNRIVAQGFPGDAWQPTSSSGTDHTLRIAYGTNNTDYQSNTTLGFSVRLFKANIVGGSGNAYKRFLSSPGSGYYGAGQLSLTISKDENWQSAQGKAGTVEEFKDNDGRMVLKRTFNEKPVGSGIIEVMSTYYVYDDLGNLSFVLPPGTVPDTGVPDDTALDTYCYQYRYDERKRLIEKKLPGRGWDHMVYNMLNQLVMNQDANQRAISQWHFTKYDALGRSVITGIYAGSGDRAYWQSAVDAQVHLWESRESNNGTEYTNNTLPTANVSKWQTFSYYDDYNFRNMYSELPPSVAESKMTRGLPTGTRTYRDDGTASEWTMLYYDDYGRVWEMVSTHHLGGTDRVVNSYSFDGSMSGSTRTHMKGSTTTIIAAAYTYDHMGRKSTTSQSINGVVATELTRMEYNEIGQLKTKKLHNGLQATNYVYNERGWLKGSSSQQFTMNLQYNDGIYPQYNGNISGQNYVNGGGNTFTYQYDRLNRLLRGTATGMSEVLEYDLMGNITSLDRDNAGPKAYSYDGNRLQSVDGLWKTYLYDANGNAVRDGRNGVELSYNHLNLPRSATKEAAGRDAPLDLAYTYDAMGTKLRKVATQVSTTTTDYVGGIQYTNGVIDFIQTEEGIAFNSGGSYTYRYNLVDHLGNARVTFGVNGNTIEVMQRDDYYAFGLRKSAPNGIGAISLQNKYLYNGKELQEELEQYDYGARFYDPIIARWNVIDPLAETDRKTSPYTYVFNNPLRFIDPDGMEGTEWVKKGNIWRWDDNVTSAEQAKAAGYDDFRAPGSIVEGARVGNDGKVGDVFLGDNASDVFYVMKPVEITGHKQLGGDKDMSLSEQGLHFIANNEGFPKRQPYNDPLGYATAGYGHLLHKSPYTAADAAKYGGMTKQDGMVLLKQDVKSRVSAVNRLVKVPLKQNQFDALVDFTFNVGEGAFGRSTLLRQINGGNMSGVSTQLLRWTNGGNKGLINRRNVEINLFVNGVY